jgi:hybrid polyketide synthase/nonribosomal peptide synthetase ACE1
MPPIVGVCNGAMIMNDGIIPHMTYERFNQSLRPKVDGTRFLDEIFNKPNLDFFVVFSSLAYVTGNLSQSPYAAANAFMVSIVEGRRARGLAGSILNLARVAPQPGRSILPFIGSGRHAPWPAVSMHCIHEPSSHVLYTR